MLASDGLLPPAGLQDVVVGVEAERAVDLLALQRVGSPRREVEEAEQLVEEALERFPAGLRAGRIGVHSQEPVLQCLDLGRERATGRRSGGCGGDVPGVLLVLID